MSIRRHLTALICAVPLMGAAFSTSAATVAGFQSTGACNLADVSTSSSCIGAVTDSGNQFFLKGVDSENKLNANGFFGSSNWSMLDRVYNAAGFQLGTTLSGSFNAASSGTYSFSAPQTFADYMLVLKSASGYAAYLLSGTSGTWSTAALVNQSGQPENAQLVTLYASTTPVVVPVPAAGLLMLSGLFALGATSVTRRGRKT